MTLKLFKGRRLKISRSLLSRLLPFNNVFLKKQKRKGPEQDNVQALCDKLDATHVESEDAKAIKAVFIKLGIDVYPPFLQLTYLEFKHMSIEEMTKRGLPEPIARRIHHSFENQPPRYQQRMTLMRNQFRMSYMRTAQALTPVAETEDSQPTQFQS